MTIGLICEYNPFHNGHLYQLNEIKRLYPDATIICVMSTTFTERGDVSLINKWDKTTIALNYGVDLVIELPFVFSSQSADIFARGAVSILNYLKVDKLYFGSETNDINLFNRLVDIQLNNKEYDKLAKQYLDTGLNYPTALSKALYDLSGVKINKPNDLLGMAYIKELKRLKSNIEVVSIQRTNDFHSKELNGKIVSASAIREALKNGNDVKEYVPELTYQYLLKEHHDIEDYFPFLKYKIISDPDLSIYQTVDEGIENRIKKFIIKSDNLEELIESVKNKRFTYNKLKRMFTHILCSFTKEEAKNISIKYIRVLGFNDKGRAYLAKIKKDIEVPIITKYGDSNSRMLEIEYRVNAIYACTLSEEEKQALIERELNKPIN